MGEAEIAAPLDRVIAHLIDFASLGKWMPRVADLRVIERRDDEALVYFRFDLPWPISDRDWTLRYRWRRDGDRFVMTWCDANDRGPAVGRAVRVAPVRGYWELSATASGIDARSLRVSRRARRLPAAQRGRADRLEAAAR